MGTGEGAKKTGRLLPHPRVEEVHNAVAAQSLSADVTSPPLDVLVLHPVPPAACH